MHRDSVFGTHGARQLLGEAVERLLTAAVAAATRLEDARPSELERAQAAADVANLQARLAQRLAELEALENPGTVA